jgi:hypothetical protein
MKSVSDALIAVGEFMTNMDTMKAALTTQAESMTDMANIKERLKSDESEKGRFNESKIPVKKNQSPAFGVVNACSGNSKEKMARGFVGKAIPQQLN